jgi:hypothetical protein
VAQPESKNVKKVIDKAMTTLTKDVPEAVKENKGLAIGAIAGYFLADTLEKNKGLVTAILGGLVGHEIDEKKKKDVF